MTAEGAQEAGASQADGPSDGERDIVRMLLRAAEKAPPAAGEDADVTDYDWNAPSRFTRSGIARINEFVQKATQRLTARLESLLPEPCPLRGEGFSQHYRDEATELLTAAPAYLARLLSEGRQMGLFVLPAARAASWVAQLLGGSGDAADGQREFSSLESGILVDAVSALTETFSACLQEAGGPPLAAEEHIQKGSCDLPGEQNVEFCRIAFLPESGDETPVLSLLILAEALDGIGGAQAEAGPPMPDDQRRRHLLAAVNMATVRGSVRLGTASAPMRDFMALERGDVLVLENAAGGPIELDVRGRTVLTGFPVQCEGWYALQVAGSCAETREG
jgi:flagellar motor switch protein FliM